MKVLIVEDNEPTAKMFKGLLEEANDVDIAHDLFEGKRKILTTVPRYDAVVLDLNLPNGEGWEVLAEIANFGIATVVVTGLNDQELIDRAMKLPVVWDYLVKGEMSAELLRASVKYATNRNETEKKLAETRRISDKAKNCGASHG